MSDLRISVTIRLPKSTIAKMDKYIKDNTPNVKSRTHAIEIALAELLKKD